LSLVIERIDKYYGYARKIAGDLGEDLMHHVILESDLLNKSEQVHEKALNRYVHVTLQNAYINRRGKFFKKYRSFEVETFEFEHIETGGYDIMPVHTILLALENEGHKLEVKVFKECYLLGKSELSFSKRTNTDYRVIRKMCKFVKDQIKERYVIEMD